MCSHSFRPRRHGDVSAAATEEATEGHPVSGEGLFFKAPPAAELFLWLLFTPLWSAVTLSVLFLLQAERMFSEGEGFLYLSSSVFGLDFYDPRFLH